MASKQQIVQELLSKIPLPQKTESYAFAPCHLGLCKALGKKNVELNIPETSSLSLGLPFGTKVSVRIQRSCDEIIVKQLPFPLPSTCLQQYIEFLDLFRPSPDFYYRVEIEPTQCAYIDFFCFEFESSFAALAIALRELFEWNIDRLKLSTLVRLTGTHACRCLYSGFVEWKEGSSPLGWDCYGYPISVWWESLQVGFLRISQEENYDLPIMHTDSIDQAVKATSSLYGAWPMTAKRDLAELKEAILYRQFERIGHIVESNSLSFHALLQTTMPPRLQWQPKTVQTMYHIWGLRNSGVPLFFSMDADANIKLLFLEKDTNIVDEFFPRVQIFAPFSTR